MRCSYSQDSVRRGKRSRRESFVALSLPSARLPCSFYRLVIALKPCCCALSLPRKTALASKIDLHASLRSDHKLATFDFAHSLVQRHAASAAAHTRSLDPSEACPSRPARRDPAVPFPRLESSVASLKRRCSTARPSRSSPRRPTSPSTRPTRPSRPSRPTRSSHMPLRRRPSFTTRHLARLPLADCRAR